MKKYVSFLIILLYILIAFASCTPKEEELAPTTPTVGQAANDETARHETDQSYDQAMDLFNDFAESNTSGARKGDKVLPCGVFKIDTTNKGILIRYDSTKNCSTKVLSGSVSMELISGNTFRDTGAILRITYNDYKIFFAANEQSLTFNGSLDVTNVQGGNYLDLKKQSLVRSVRGFLIVTFNDGSAVTRTWRITKRRTIALLDTADINTLAFTLSADSANIVEKGLTKDGQAFKTEVNTPMQWENCGSDLAGPFVLKRGSWRWVVAGLGFAEAKAGYRFENGSATETNDCTANGYLIDYDINGTQAQEFQYY